MNEISNLMSSFRRKKLFTRLLKSLSILLFYFLIATAFFVPTQPAFSDDGDDLLLYIPSMIAANAGWRNTTLSHPIPITYKGEDVEPYDEEIRQCRIVQVEDGYWIAYAQYGDEYLYLLKTNLEGRTVIPPFLLTTLIRTDDTADSYQFTLVPRDEGGVQVLTTEKDGGSTSKPAILHDYLFDRHGKIIRSLSVMKERDYYNQGFKSLWAARTVDGRTVFAAFSDNAIWAGVYTDSGEAQIWEVEPKETHWPYPPDCFAAHYDAALDRLYILYGNFYDPVSGEFTHMTRWTLNGTRDKNVDLSSQFGDLGRSETYQLLDTPKGLLVSLPGDPYRFFILNPDCTVKQEVAVTGLSVQVFDDGDGYSWHVVSIDDRNIVRVAWPGSGGTTPRRSYYAAFNLSGNLLVPPMPVSQDDRYTALHPHVFVDGRRTTHFYSISDSSYQRLYCRHMAYDFLQDQPDLVVSVPHILQSPDYATLDSTAAFHVRVFNRGEAANTAASMTLTHNGDTWTQSVSVLQPGESQELEFPDIPTPAYLTSLPTVTIDLANGYWTGNNDTEALVRYPGRTPVYPPGSVLYTWTVRDSATKESIEHAQVITTLPAIRTADGDTEDVVILNESDASGEISIRLPDGTYDFRISRHGYPSETPSITVPVSPPQFLELEPPGKLTLSFYDSKLYDPLHPVPNRVFLTLDHDKDPYDYSAPGDENGLILDEVMRGTYNYTVEAFGYVDTTAQFDITGGADNPYDVILTPCSRGTITGTVVTGSVCTTPLEGANVALEGTGIGSVTDGDGNFTLADIPYGTYTLSFWKEDHVSAHQSITVNDTSQSIEESPCLPAITVHTDCLGTEKTMMAWNRIDSFPGFLDVPSYEIHTAYGVFDFSGLLSYGLAADAADFYNVYLDISGRNWYYYAVSSEFSLGDIFCSGLSEIADGAGDLAGFLFEHVGGALIEDFLSAGISGGGSGGTTIVRVDRVALYDGDTLLWDSPMLTRQEYSTDGPMGYVVSGAHTADINNVEFKVYLKVMNENYCAGPLFLMDTFRLVWHYKDGKFELDKDKTIQHPADYPSLPD